MTLAADSATGWIERMPAAAGHWSREDVLRMRAFNADLIADRALTATVLPVGDGVAVAVRR